MSIYGFKVLIFFIYYYHETNKKHDFVCYNAIVSNVSLCRNIYITNHSSVMVSVKFLFDLMKSIGVFFLMLKAVAIAIGS